jgi:hypothetical protein
MYVWMVFSMNMWPWSSFYSFHLSVGGGEKDKLLLPGFNFECYKVKEGGSHCRKHEGNYLWLRIQFLLFVIFLFHKSCSFENLKQWFSYVIPLAILMVLGPSKPQVFFFFFSFCHYHHYLFRLIFWWIWNETLQVNPL